MSTRPYLYINVAAVCLSLCIVKPSEFILTAIICKTLTELDSRILIVVDDIDRLSNQQIQPVYQLVNAVAGFPNITYLLSFDKDIVERTLSDVQYCDGEEYLKK